MKQYGERGGDGGDATGDLFGKSFEVAAAQPVDGRKTRVGYVGKYATLAQYLGGLQEATWILEFKRAEEIEERGDRRVRVAPQCLSPANRLAVVDQ